MHLVSLLDHDWYAAGGARLPDTPQGTADPLTTGYLHTYYILVLPAFFCRRKRRARHGPSGRQRMYHNAERMLHKAGQKKHGGHSSERWHNDYEYRASLTRIGWTEQVIMLFDRIALEHHSYVATRAERIRKSEHWILKLNQDGAQLPFNQRPDFAQAKREWKNLHDEHMAKTQLENRTTPRSQQVRQRKRTSVRRN